MTGAERSRPDRRRRAVPPLPRRRPPCPHDRPAITSTPRGGTLSPRTSSLPPAAALRERHALTRREAEVTLLLAEGLSTAQIAERLALGPHTVRHHGESIFRKLGVRTRKGLALALLRGTRA